MKPQADHLFNKKKLIEAIRQPRECFAIQYDLGIKILQRIDNLPSGVIDEKFRTLIEIHQQIIDNLSCIGMLITTMHKNQAGILASTIFELSHIGIYIFNNESALDHWAEMRGDFSKEFKESAGGIKKIVKDNVEHSGQKDDGAE